MNNLLDAIIAAKLAGGGGGGGSGLTEDVKQALMDVVNNVAWINGDGQQYIDELEAALYPLSYITAAYTQSGPVYDTDSLDSLKADLVVTAFYQGGDSKTVTDYTLSGTLEEGASTIKVSYGGKTTTFDVTVTKTPLWEAENRAFNGGTIDPELYNQPGVYIPLFSTDKDWTIIYDVELETSPTSGNSSAYALIRLNDWASGVFSLYFAKNSSSDTVLSFIYMSETKTLGRATTGRHRFVLSHAVGSGIATAQYRYENEEIETVTIEQSFVSSSKNVVIGRATGTQQLPKGTINHVAIFDCLLSNAIITDFLGT